MTDEDLINVKVRCIHNNEIGISMKLNDKYWDDGVHLELKGCKLCIKRIEAENVEYKIFRNK